MAAAAPGRRLFEDGTELFMKHFLTASLMMIASTSLADEAKPGAAQENKQRIALWKGRAPVGDGTFEEAEAWITVYRPEKGNGAAIVICPGGGYSQVVVQPEGHGI